MQNPNPKKTLLPLYFFPSLEHRTTAAVLPAPDHRLSIAFPAYPKSLLLLRIRVKEPSFLPHLQAVRKPPTILTGNRRIRRRNASTVVFVIDFMGSVHGKCFYCCRCCCFPGWSICGNCCCPGWMNCGNCCFHLPSSSSGSASRGGRSGEVEPLRGDMLAGSTDGTVAVPSHGFCLQYSSLTHQGHYPDEPDRENQDALCIKTNLQENTNLHFFGVFDGHGYFGAKCANFVRDKLVDLLSADSQLVEDPAKAYNTAFLAVNALLHESEIDDSLSGTTAITVLISGDTLIVANVGDSRAVAAVSKDGCLVAEDLSHDQTPFRKDEYERVRLCGARVLSIDQVEGIKDPGIQSWGEEGDDEGDPPRLWVQDAMFPGTAFTRSVGDSTAESIGVIALPEVLTIKITPNHLFLVIASDGIFEFMSSQAVVNKVASFKDPRDACSAVAAESYKLWLEHENRTDDITIIVVHIKDLCNPGAGTSSETIQITTKAFVSSENLRAERSPTSITEPLHPPQGSFSDPRTHCDIALARSPACAAPPVHSISLEK